MSLVAFTPWKASGGGVREGNSIFYDSITFLVSEMFVRMFNLSIKNNDAKGN